LQPERTLAVHINNAYIHKVLEVHLHKVHSREGKGKIEPGRAPDELVLSPKAADLQQVKQVIAELPETRIGMVRGIRNRVASGFYEPDAQELAQIIAGFAADKIGKGVGQD
jgi:hypothetical protein